MKNNLFHPLSIVESKDIGNGTQVWAWTHIMAGAKVGDNCNIGEHCFIENNVEIGNDCVIKNGVCVWDGISIEDKVFIGPSVVLTNDKYPRSKEPWEMQTTRIKRGASVGAGSVIVCGIIIGESAMVAAGSVVTKSIDPFTLVKGNPALPAGYVCVCGRELKKTENNMYSCRNCAREFMYDTEKKYLFLLKS